MLTMRIQGDLLSQRIDERELPSVTIQLLYRCLWSMETRSNCSLEKC